MHIHSYILNCPRALFANTIMYISFECGCGNSWESNNSIRMNNVELDGSRMKSRSFYSRPIMDLTLLNSMAKDFS